MSRSSHSIPRTLTLVLVALVAVAALVTPAVAGAAEYPPPVLSDTYGLEQSILAEPQAGCDMSIEAFAFDHEGYLWTVENDWYNGGFVPGTTRLVKRTTNGTRIGIYGQGLGVDSLWWGTSVAVDPLSGQLYVGDGFHARVAIFDPATGSYLGQLGGPMGGSLSAITDEPYGFGWPADIVFEPNGNLYVSDYDNHRILKYDPAHTFVTAWGVVGGGSGPSHMLSPNGISLDGDGDVWVADSGNNRVQHYTSSGAHVATLRPLTNGTEDKLSYPLDVQVDAYDTIYVVDRPSYSPWQGGRFSRYGAQFDFLGEYGTAGQDGHLDRPTCLDVDMWGSVWITNKVADGQPGALEGWSLNTGAPDLVPPVTTSDAPDGWTRGPVKVHLSSTDASSPVVATYYSTDGSEPSLSYDSSITITAEGVNTLKYYSVDRPANEEQVTTELVRIDNVKPSTTTDAQEIYYGTAIIRFSASDDRSGVVNTWWTVDGGLPNNQSTISISAQGAHTVSYWSEDAAGNREDTQYAYVLVEPPDSDPPVTYWAEYRPDWFRTNPTITLVANDTVSGVHATYYRLNGSEPTTYTAPFVWTQEGTTALSYWSVDNMGHVESVHTDSIRLDRTKPVSTANLPVDPVGSATVTFSATDSISGVSELQWKFDTDSSWTTGNTAQIPTYGNFTLWHRAIDVAGNAEDPKAITVTVLQPDSDPPITTSNIPPTGWVRGPHELLFIAEDDISGVEETRYSLDGSPFQVWVRDTVFVPDGIHSVQWYSTDIRGNVETTRSATLKVDSVPPTTTDNHVDFYSGPAAITLVANDNLSPTTTHFRIDGGTAQTGNTVNLNDYRNYSVEYWSEDDAGNSETHHFFEVSVNPPDSDPPVTTFTGPSGWQKGSAQFSLSAYDASSTVKATKYSTDGVYFAPYLFPVTITTEGTTTVTYFSTDFYNNDEAAKSAQLFVDASAPLTTSDAVANYTEKAIITLSPSDTYSGVDRTYYRVNGGSWVQGTDVTVNWNRYRRTHTVDWYSVDEVGNVEGVKSATFDIRLQSRTEQEDNANIVYRGSWDFSGNTYLASTSDPGAFSLIAFQGTKLDLYSHVGDFYGKARVTLLDSGVPGAIIDQYDSYPHYGDFQWSTGDLEFGDYVVKIEYLGQQNVASDDDVINIDYVRVEGSLIQVPDSAPPTTTNNAPAGWVHGPVTVALSSTDTTTGVAAIYATTDGSTPDAGDPYTGPISVSAEGVTTLKYYAVDARGNAESVKTATVRVDNTAPVTNTNAQSSYNGAASIALLPNDPLSGVASTKWRVDGGAWNTGTAVSVPFSLGTHLLEWYSTDNVGNAETIKSASFYMANRYDQAAAEVSLRNSWTLVTDANMVGGSYRYATSPSSVADVSFIGTQFYWIAPKAGAYGKAKVYLDGQYAATVDLYNPTFVNKRVIWGTSGLTDAFHHVRIEVLGQKNDASTGTRVLVDAFDIVGSIVTADLAAPTTTHDAPAGWSPEPLDVTLTATDDPAGVKRTTYTLDGGAATEYTQPIPIGQDGVHTLEFSSVDVAGNVEPTRTATVRIDTGDPSATDDAPASWSTSPIDLTLSASDDLSGIERILYSMDGGPTAEYAGPIAISVDGTHTVTYQAVDRAGNTTEDHTATVLIDKTAPSTTDDAPTGWVDGPVTVTLGSADPVSSVAGIVYQLNGGPETTYTAPIDVDAEGSTAIEYAAIDVAGNRETTHTATVRIDTSTPLTIDNAPGGWVSGLIDVVLTATDEFSGVSATNVSVNGGPFGLYTQPIPFVEEGTYTLDYFTTDAVGNQEAVRSTTLRLDNTPPATTSNATARYVDVATIALAANDARSGVESTSYRVDGGAWQFGTTVTVSTPGAHTLEFASTDAAGNAETVKSASFEVVRRVEQTSDYVSYTGSWSDYSDGLMTAGSARYAFKAGSTVNFAFTGTRWEWVGNMASSYGKARVTIDDGTPVDIDLYSPTFKARQVIFNTGALSNGRHTVRIEVLGTKSAASSNTYVYVDAFDVLGEFSTYAFEQNHDLVRLTGTWTSGNDSALSGGSASYSFRPGSTAIVAFTGKRIDWLGPKGSNYGKVMATLDNGEPFEVDLYSPTFKARETVWSSGVLSDGPHTLRIQVTGTKNASSSSTYVWVDAFQVVGTPSPLRHEQSDYMIRQSAGWTQAADTNMSGGSYCYTTSSTGSTKVSFIGKRLDWIGTKGSNYGIVRVSVDGGAPVEIDLYSATFLGRQTLFSTGMLAEGRHTVSIQATGTKNASSTGRMIVIDAFDLVGVLSPQRTEQSDSAFAYTAGWTSVNDGNMSGGSAINSTVSGTRAYVAFTGRSIDLVGPKGSNYGKARVTIDGSASTEVDLYSPTFQSSQSVFTSGVLAEGPHTLMVEVLGTKNESSSGTRVWVDAFDVVGEVTPADAVAPTTSSSATSNWSAVPVSVTLSATDAMSGVLSTRYSLDGAPSATYSSPVTISGNGVHTLAYSSVDRSGNREATQTATVRIDGAPPVTSDDAPSDWVRAPRDVTLTPSDSGSGPKYTLYRLPGGAVTTYTAPVSVTEPGINSIEYFSVDVAGNREATRTATVKIDETAPITTDDASGLWTSGPAVLTLSASDSQSGGTTTWVRHGEAIDFAPYLGPVLIDAEGISTVEYYSVDRLSNREATQTCTVQVDDTPPLSSDDAPTEWVAGTQAVSLSATDSCSGVSALSYSLDGGAVQPYVSPFEVTGHGSHTVEYFAVDNVGNLEPTKSATVRIDTQAPVSTDDAPDGWSAGSAIVQLSATDPDSGVSHITYSIDGGPDTTYAEPITVTGEGVHTITYQAEDAVGNREAPQSATVRIDDTAPVTSLLSPTDWRKGSIDIALAADDAASGAAATFVSVNGSPFELYSGSLAHTAEGTSTVSFYSVDEVGNAEQVREAVLLVDNTPPVTTDDAPTAWVGSPVDVALVAADQGSGVAAITYRLDGATHPYTDPISIDGSGETVFEYCSTDIVGNVEQTRTATVRIDTEAPVTTGDFAPHYVGSANVTLEPVDGQSGVASTAWRVDGAQWNDGTHVSVSTPGTHTVEFFSVDEVGCEETPVSATFVVAERFEESNANIIRTNAWTSVADGSMSGGNAVYSFKTGATINVAFNGTRIDWIGPMGSSYGKANVSVDGGAPQLIDLYSATFRNRQVLFSSGMLPSGPHTLRIEVAGLKNDASSGYRVWADAFDIVGAITSADLIAPVTSSNAPAGWVGGSASIALTASDNLSGVGSTHYSVDGGSSSLYTAPIVVSGHGIHTIDYYSIDAVGNREATQTATVRIDTAAPSTTANAPADWVKGSATIELAVTDADSGVQSTSYAIDGGQTHTYSAPIAVSGEGTHTVTYSSLDAVGNAEQTQSTTVRVDDTSPTTADNAPEAWQPGTTLVTLESSDALSGVSEVRYSLDAGAEQTYNAPISVSGNGVHTIDYYSIDIVGNRETTRTATVRIDTVAPNSSDDAPADWVKGPVDVSIAAEDSGSGVESTTYSLDGGPTLTYSGPIAVSGDGVHTIAYSSVDEVGNAEQTNSTTVRIDDTAPTTSGTFGSRYTSAVAVPLTASDARSGVESTYWRVDGGSWNTSTTVNVSVPGTHTVEYYSTDSAGNAESPKSATFTLWNRIEQNHTALVTTGWTQYNDGNMSGGSAMYSYRAGTVMNLAFTGTRVEWIGPKGSNYGIVSIRIDGGAPVLVDLYSATFKTKQVLFSSAGLAEGNHTLTIEVTGTKNASSTNTFAWIDAFDLYGGLAY